MRTPEQWDRLINKAFKNVARWRADLDSLSGEALDEAILALIASRQTNLVGHPSDPKNTTICHRLGLSFTDASHHEIMAHHILRRGHLDDACLEWAFDQNIPMLYGVLALEAPRKLIPADLDPTDPDYEALQSDAAYLVHYYAFKSFSELILFKMTFD